MNTTVKNITKELGAVRKQVISELKKFAKQHGKGGAIKTIEFADVDLSFVQSNTENYIWAFDSKGNLQSDNIEDATFENLSTDLLLSILTELTKKSK